MSLTDAECDAFRRLPLPFNGMVRAIYEAGAEAAVSARAADVEEMRRKIEENGQRVSDLLQTLASLKSIARRMGLEVP